MAGVMKKFIIALVTLILNVFIVLFVACTDFDSSTDLGKEIISEVDSSLTKIDYNFKEKTFGKSLVIGAYSRPETNNADGFGLHIVRAVDDIISANDLIRVGYTDQHTVLAYVEFSIDTFIRPLYDTNAVPQSLTLQLELDTAFNQYPSLDAAKGHVIVSKAQDIKSPNTKTNRFPADTGGTLDTVFFARNAIQKSISLTSVMSDTTLLIQDIFKKRTKVNKNLTVKFAFYLRGIEGQTDLLHLKRIPKLIMGLKKMVSKDSSITIYDQINCTYADYSVYEDDFLATQFSVEPISSFGPERVAVFKIALDPLWNTLKPDKNNILFDQILSAGFSFKADSIIENHFNNPNTEDTVNLSFQYAFTSKRQISYDSLTHFLESKKASVLLTTDSLHKQHFILEVTSELQEIQNSGINVGYFYIRQLQPWGAIRWAKPEFEVTLTTK